MAKSIQIKNSEFVPKIMNNSYDINGKVRVVVFDFAKEDITVSNNQFDLAIINSNAFRLLSINVSCEGFKEGQLGSILLEDMDKKVEIPVEDITLVANIALPSKGEINFNINHSYQSKEGYLLKLKTEESTTNMIQLKGYVLCITD